MYNSRSNDCFVTTSTEQSKELLFTGVVNREMLLFLLKRKKERTNTDLHSDETLGQSVCTNTYNFNHAKS